MGTPKNEAGIGHEYTKDRHRYRSWVHQREKEIKVLRTPKSEAGSVFNNVCEFAIVINVKNRIPVDAAKVWNYTIKTVVYFCLKS